MERRIPGDYVERVYAGWLGKVIGVRHGSNIEGWDYERIKAVYGEIKGYLFDFKNFAADDDTNGPYFFIRALEDYTHTDDITPGQIALTWLNYAPYEHGFYWWGGYGVSTEHTAYLNLQSGIEAPRSGSILQNGRTVAEQIGGQIFIDSWGLVIPCDYALAAQYAKKAASVSHDGNGMYGGMFIAACISAAFGHNDIKRVLDCAFSVIPHDCEYARMGRDVWGYYERNRGDWRACFEFVREKYGYQHYKGVCHIIPNSAVMILSLLYGEGDFSRTINICNMCGWDTDCNVGNVGTIMGVLCGLEGIDGMWREPIGDLLICSSVVGNLNILDIPGCSYYLAGLGFKIANEEPPQRWRNSIRRGERSYDFELPGSTHSFRVARGDIKLSNCQSEAYTGQGCLCVYGEEDSLQEEVRIYLQTYYRPDDFNDSRYDPAFSPLIYPGQTIECALKPDADILCRIYVLDDNSGEALEGDAQMLKRGQWTRIKWQIPPKDGICLSQAGVKLYQLDETAREHKPFVCYIDDFSISGCPDYALDFSKERMEGWSILHQEVSQFTRLKGIWELEGGKLYGSCSDLAECYTGSPQWTDYEVSANITPVMGRSHRLLFRLEGAVRGYAVGLEEGGRLILFKKDRGFTSLIEAEFLWEIGNTYTLEASIEGDTISIAVDGVEKLTYHDKSKPYLSGFVGFGVYGGSRCSFDTLAVRPLGQTY